MSHRRKIGPPVAVTLLLVTTVFLCFLGLLIQNLMHEEYRRIASWQLPHGHPARGTWQNFVGYPVNWTVVRQVTAKGWLLILPFVAAVIFALRLLILSFFVIKRPQPPRKNLWRVMHVGAGIVLCGLTVSMAASLRNEWFGGLPVQEMGYCASATFLVVPIWLALASSPKNAANKTVQVTAGMRSASIQPESPAAPGL